MRQRVILQKKADWVTEKPSRLLLRLQTIPHAEQRLQADG
jgi:hypothetical protein